MHDHCDNALVIVTLTFHPAQGQFCIWYKVTVFHICLLLWFLTWLSVVKVFSSMCNYRAFLIFKFLSLLTFCLPYFASTERMKVEITLVPILIWFCMCSLWVLKWVKFLNIAVPTAIAKLCSALCRDIQSWFKGTLLIFLLPFHYACCNSLSVLYF